ncbi:MAG: hypothetical protein HQL69_23295 [Magnetococcales bacterium]|nr:hypothetical protein [Magnetococcales bacterium]
MKWKLTNFSEVGYFTQRFPVSAIIKPRWQICHPFSISVVGLKNGYC